VSNGESATSRDPSHARLPSRGWFLGLVLGNLYCPPGPDCKLIQAKYFGKVRDDIEIAECGVSQLKVKANDNDPDESR
jgi:hypothetical protein